MRHSASVALLLSFLFLTQTAHADDVTVARLAHRVRDPRRGSLSQRRRGVRQVVAAGGKIHVEEQKVPVAVFERNVPTGPGAPAPGTSAIGALERIRQRRLQKQQ